MRRSQRLLDKFDKSGSLKKALDCKTKSNEAEENRFVADQAPLSSVESFQGNVFPFKNNENNVSNNIAPEMQNHFMLEEALSTNDVPGTESKLILVPEQNCLATQNCTAIDFEESKINLHTKIDVNCEIIDLTKSPSLRSSHKPVIVAAKVVVAKKENKRKRTASTAKRKGKIHMGQPKRARLRGNDVPLKALPPVETFQPSFLNNYDNPVKDLTIPPILRVQPVENGGPYYDNAIDPRLFNLNSVQRSLLPRMYPPHFTQQLPPEPVANFSSQLHNDHSRPPPNEYANCYPSPDFTQLFDFSSTSTTPLSNTMLDLFGSDNIREVLQLEKPVYRLSVQHLQVLALILNLNLDYVRNLIEKILKLGPDVLQKVAMAFCVPETVKSKTQNDYNVKPFCDFLTPDASSIVDASQSPRATHRYSSTSQHI